MAIRKHELSSREETVAAPNWIWFAWGVVVAGWLLLLAAGPLEPTVPAFPLLAGLWVVLFGIVLVYAWRHPAIRYPTWSGGAGLLLLTAAALGFRYGMLTPAASLWSFSAAILLFGLGLGCIAGGILGRLEERCKLP